MHPRRARLGLIEAWKLDDVGIPNLTCIRGARASASLKLCFPTSSNPIRAWHPRRARLGLIEAVDVGCAAALDGLPHPRRARLGLIEASAPEALIYRHLMASEARAPRMPLD